MKRRGVYKSKRVILEADFELLVIEAGFNPRFDYGDVDSLGESIYENGLVRPIEVFQESDSYVVDDGHRRHKACCRNIEKYGNVSLKHELVPIIVNPKRDLSTRLAATVLYNDGKPLSPAEEALVFSKLRDDGKPAKAISKLCGKSVIHVLDRLILVDSDPEIMKAVLDGSLKSSIAVKAAKAIKTLGAEKASRILSDIRKGDSEAIKKASRINLNGSFRIRKPHRSMLIEWLKAFNKDPDDIQLLGRIEGLIAVLDIDEDAWNLMNLNYDFLSKTKLRI